MTEAVLRVIVLAAMGAVSVSVWTLRVALTAEGRKGAAAATAGVEAVVFALVFASVLSSLASPLEVAGYALGVAAGTYLGLLIDGKLSTGQSAVQVIVEGDGGELAAALQSCTWPVTRLAGDGLGGTVTMLLVVVDTVRTANLLDDVARLCPGAFWTVERLQRTHPSPLPAGYQQVRTGRRSH